MTDVESVEVKNEKCKVELLIYGTMINPKIHPEIDQMKDGESTEKNQLSFRWCEIKWRAGHYQRAC